MTLRGSLQPRGRGIARGIHGKGGGRNRRLRVCQESGRRPGSTVKNGVHKVGLCLGVENSLDRRRAGQPRAVGLRPHGERAAVRQEGGSRFAVEGNRVLDIIRRRPGASIE